ncbi:MAG: zinc-binding dehydrogenase [Chloroflexi bacterium]|nr:zinc-binding dehydrogenase [Chloroflexota bacterium]MDA1297278.1 zinc-binding dehydrogenase [Chloroflexota bacterium]
MKAAVYQGKQRFEVTDIAAPEPGPGQVQIKVRRSAICGTDVHAFMYGLAPAGSVLGHEFAGTISKLGKGVTRWKAGDRVIGGGGEWPEGKAPPTRSHPRYNYRTMGFADTRTRGYAEYTVLDEWAPLPIPAGVTDEAASITEPCSVAVHAVRRSALRLGDTVGVIGAGPIGLLVTQAALAAGASRVIVSEPAPARAAAARQSGAAEVVDPFEVDAVERIVELTGGVGPDVVFDCAGLKNTLDQAFLSVRRSGQVILVAVPWEPLPILPSDWMAREIDFRASWGGLPEDWRISLDLMRLGKVNAGVLISENSLIDLEQIQETFEALMNPSVQVQTVFRL